MAKFLHIIPQARNCIAMVVIHHQCLVGATTAAGVLHKLVHETVIKCLLLSSMGDDPYRRSGPASGQGVPDWLDWDYWSATLLSIH